MVAAFGEEVLDAEGALDRAKLGDRVFGDDEARAKLESILQPADRRAEHAAHAGARGGRATRTRSTRRRSSSRRGAIA